MLKSRPSLVASRPLWSGWRFNPAFGRCGALTTSRAMRFWLCLCAWRAQVQRRHVFPLRGTSLQGADASDMWHVTASGQQLTAQSGDSSRTQELRRGSQSAGRRYRQGCLTTTASGGDDLHEQNRKEQVLGRQQCDNGARLVARRQGAGVEVRSLFAAHIHELASGGPSKIG